MYYVKKSRESGRSYIDSWESWLESKDNNEKEGRVCASSTEKGYSSRDSQWSVATRWLQGKVELKQKTLSMQSD